MWSSRGFAQRNLSSACGAASLLEQGGLRSKRLADSARASGASAPARLLDVSRDEASTDVDEGIGRLLDLHARQRPR